jgi:GNAT superfamily N-acetyltransferase
VSCDERRERHPPSANHGRPAAISGWFEDPDTRRFLGGPEWPTRILAIADRSIGTTFRGATQTGAHHHLAFADGTPVGYIDCGTFDRRTTYGGEGPDGPIITETIDAVTGSIAFVTDPTVRGRGLGALLARTGRAGHRAAGSWPSHARARTTRRGLKSPIVGRNAAGLPAPMR